MINIILEKEETMTDSNEILLEQNEGVAIITLNRPERFNSFTTSMYREFPRILDQLKRDDEVKAVILTGAGKGFCAGSDVSDRLGKRLKEGGEGSRFETLQRVGAIALNIADFDKPIIGAINGTAVGAGLSLTLLCDIRLASEKARFGAVWLNVGLVPDVGATYSLPRIVGKEKAMALILSREVIGAEEALKIGLVSKVFPHDQLMKEAKKLAKSITSAPSVAVELTKRALQRSLDNDLRTQLDYESYAQNICRQTEDHKEGIRAFAEKRKPVFIGK
ncbi:MAG: enoyl-CoA hydratase [Deltaproteobacteria bacterium]|nr:enoyl-CoA hydratase [Deltaproteobacteria bacterium]